MERIPRIHIEGGFYYVTIRGDHNEKIFKDAEDYQGYLNLLKKYKEQYGFKLFAFVLLANHLRLLIELKEGVTLSAIMHDFNCNYTKYFNKKYNLKGHLFQERYELNLMEKSHYLIYMSAYIHLYPQMLDLTPRIAAYPYSSYPIYLYYSQLKGGCVDADAGEKPFGFDVGMEQEIIEALGGLGEKDYADYLESISMMKEIKTFAKLLKNRVILGSEEFKVAAKLKIETHWQEEYRLKLVSLRQRISGFEFEKERG
jgi:REP element-mobilizing transposase RayT